MISRVVFTLDGRHFMTVRSPDADGRFGVTVDRESLSRGKHMLRAKVVFVREAKRSPEFLRLSFRRCPERATPKAVQARPAAKCGAQPFLAWVRGARIRHVLFRLDGRRLGRVSAADWRGLGKPTTTHLVRRAMRSAQRCTPRPNQPTAK